MRSRASIFFGLIQKRPIKIWDKEDFTSFMVRFRETDAPPENPSYIQT